MNTWVYVQIDIIPIIALCLILYNSLVHTYSYVGMTRFRWLILQVICILIVDAASWFVLANAQSYSTPVVWLVNIIYFLLTECISYSWFTYVYYQIHDNMLSRSQRKRIRIGTIPLIAICMLIILSPMCQAVFYIGEDNSYHRGSFHIVQVMVGFGYIAYASLLAYRKSRQVQTMEKRNEFRFLCFIALLPFVGGILQILNYNYIFLWIFTAAATFLIYIDFQHHQISIDSLTTLHNRGSLESKLIELADETSGDWFFIMIDVDSFKIINDRFGHVEGDHALRIVAENLKDTFCSCDAFVARYGGDEFAVIVSVSSKEELEKLIADCLKKLDEKAAKQRLPYKLKLSVGYARYTDKDDMTIHDLIHTADLRMYDMKKRHKIEKR